MILSNKRVYDVAVVGAGPAGLTAMLELEKHFDSLLLLERKKFPRNKLCAGVLPPRIHELVTIPDEVRQRPLKGYRIHSPSGLSVESKFLREGVIVNRKDFDAFLLERVNTKLTHQKVMGLKFKQNHVQIQGEKTSYQAKIVIGADGVNSIIRKAINAPMQKIALAMQTDISLPEAIINDLIGNWFEVYYFFPYGYGWISPLKDSVKVGLGGISSAFWKEPKKFFNRFFDLISEKIANRERGTLRTWRIPMSGPLEILAGERSFLVGDAGGFVYPGTGEGVYYGMKSGKIAGETIKEAFEQNRYDKFFLQNIYSQKLAESSLLVLRSTTFIEDVLASNEAAEKYVKRLAILTSQSAPSSP